MNLRQSAIQAAMANEDLEEVYMLFRGFCALLEHEARRSVDPARQKRLMRILQRLEIRVWFDLVFANDDDYKQAKEVAHAKR